MKKTIFILMASALVLASCGASAEDAATEICDCYKEAVEVHEKSGDAQTTDEMLANAEAMKEAIAKGDECQKKWKEKYDGKVDIDEFKKALKEKDEKIYNMLDERGLF